VLGVLACERQVAPPPPAAPAERPDPAVLLEQVRGGEFEALEETMAAAQARWEGSHERERALVQAWLAFAVSDPALTPFFERWVEERPESWAGHLARAHHHSAIGWRARGGKSGEKTSDGQHAELRRQLTVAVQEARRALALRPGLVAAHVALIGAARAGAPGAGSCSEAVERAFADIGPASFQVRYSAMLCLLPKWGGSARTMLDFLSETRRQQDANPQLIALEGLLAAEMGRAASVDGRYEDAVEHYTEALRYGGYLGLHLEQARCLYHLERYEEALVEVDKGLRLAPDDRGLLRMKADTLSRLGRPEPVQELLARLAAIDPAGKTLEDGENLVADAWDQQGYQALRQRRYQDAVAAFDRVVEIRPAGAKLLINRGQAWAMLRDVDRALADFEQAARLEPTRYEAYVGLDRALAQRQDWAAIAAHWQRYLDLVPNDGRAYLERAGTYHHWGKRQEEGADLQRACELGVERACQILGR
jgi:tetratricopeptide (TPR) repeat protein